MMLPPQSEPLGFVRREYERLTNEIARRLAVGEDVTGLRGAQQALAWSLEPAGFGAPYDVLTGIPADSEGCSECPRPPLS